MLNNNERNAMAEVLEYLKGIDKKDIEKISPKFLEYLNSNASKDYKVNIDFTKPLMELSLLKETKALITYICYKYWCETEEEKEELVRLIENSSVIKKYESENEYINNEESIMDLNYISNLVETKLYEKYQTEFKVMRIGNRYGTGNFNETTAYCSPKDNSNLVFEVLIDVVEEKIVFDSYYLKMLCYELENAFYEELTKNKINAYIKTTIIGKNVFDKKYNINEFTDNYKNSNFLMTIIIENSFFEKDLLIIYENIRNRFSNIYLKSLVFYLDKDDYIDLKEKSLHLVDIPLNLIEEYKIRKRKIIQIHDNSIVKIK